MLPYGSHNKEWQTCAFNSPRAMCAPHKKSFTTDATTCKPREEKADWILRESFPGKIKQGGGHLYNTNTYEDNGRRSLHVRQCAWRTLRGGEGDDVRTTSRRIEQNPERRNRRISTHMRNEEKLKPRRETLYIIITLIVCSRNTDKNHHSEEQDKIAKSTTTPQHAITPEAMDGTTQDPLLRLGDRRSRIHVRN